jgi:hypothetical protein
VSSEAVELIRAVNAAITARDMRAISEHLHRGDRDPESLEERAG